MAPFSITDLPSTEELQARSEHLALAIETAFREWLILNWSKTPPELLLQFMRINQKIDELKLKKAMLEQKNRELDQKEAVAADNREYDNKFLAVLDRNASSKDREVSIKDRLASVKERESVVKIKWLEYKMSQGQAKPPAQPAPEPAAAQPSFIKTPPSIEHSTDELVAMEWDLRSFLHFGDLRPFDWCTGLRTIYFPDRSAHPAPPVPNVPDDVPLVGLVARPDGYFILPTPVAELPKDWEKQLLKPSDKPPYTPVPPIIVDGQVQWQHFIEPACPNTEFPYNTALPVGWTYGDPIPGMPEEFA